jgi:hypothetical protein
MHFETRIRIRSFIWKSPDDSCKLAIYNPQRTLNQGPRKSISNRPRRYYHLISGQRGLNSNVTIRMSVAISYHNIMYVRIAIHVWVNWLTIIRPNYNNTNTTTNSTIGNLTPIALHNNRANPRSGVVPIRGFVQASLCNLAARRPSRQSGDRNVKWLWKMCATVEWAV